MSETGRALRDALATIVSGQTNATLSGAVKAVVPTTGPEAWETLSSVAEQVGLLRLSADKQAVVAESTEALVQRAAPLWTGVASPWTDGLTGVAKALVSGLTLGPLISGLASMVRGKRNETSAAMETYTPPEEIHLVGTASQGAGSPLMAIDYGQDGLPRLVQETGGGAAKFVEATASVQPRLPSSALTQNDHSAGSSAGWAPSITVNVQAMDSRSFLDHSDEIAHAVREAILNAHPLGDVVNEI